MTSCRHCVDANRTRTLKKAQLFMRTTWTGTGPSDNFGDNNDPLRTLYGDVDEVAK